MSATRKSTSMRASASSTPRRPTCGPNGGAFTTCHGPTVSNGDAGSWKRRWDTSAANTDGTECANCHGGSPTDARPDGLDPLGDGRRASSRART